ncbi:hypothetical protein MM213_12170 [Belliella sp. R4-6]|uniref:Cellobiose phosphorylase n=1 Tax=Belliella alkalica TaxID=1730871 RepID=A0ABS9VED1_9BACT|nr:hypothetical protein [Belliella alkalica]MCH7414248.1 hypothetical protein [Belliella alkalica]
MKQYTQINVNNCKIEFPKKEVKGEFVILNGEEYYKVQNVDQMPPFFMSIVSHSDHWMFIGSNGALSAGRKDEENVLFPYYTDDKILTSQEETGSKTVFRIQNETGFQLWMPFSDRYKGIFGIDRSLYKSRWGNKVIFEEINQDLQLSFSYSWSFSAKFGFVKESNLVNIGTKDVRLEVLDGIQNILPYGVSSQLQLQRSNLVNAYKRNELHKETGLGIFALSSLIVDRAEPSEALKATIAVSLGVNADFVLLSSRQVENFCKSEIIQNEVDVKGISGSYFNGFQSVLVANKHKSWYNFLDINQSQANIRNLIEKLEKDKNAVLTELVEDLASGTSALKQIVAKADGFQLTGDKLSVNRHYSNVLFNVMRGGVFEENYTVEKQDFINYVHEVNIGLVSSNQNFFENLAESIDYDKLQEAAYANGDTDLIRICAEYLPLSFSRRHGDPSRPWNKFSIELQNIDGSPRRAYAGNWRDIFQNWEALAVSFPNFIQGMIFKFLNASSIDGYNPYRVSRTGVDWEVIEEEDPWSYIGYWGDHQLIYLLRLLEVGRNHKCLTMAKVANEPWFVFANVPYRIKSFGGMVDNPQDTIDFDAKINAQANKRFSEFGADGKLVWNSNNEILKSGFLEKIMISWLTKLYNFVPDAGIWMNTQRPEWNDANNALVGNGTSMVTLNYMYKFTNFMKEWIEEEQIKEVVLHQEVSELLYACATILEKYRQNLVNSFDNQARREFVMEMGMEGEKYRSCAYNGFKGLTVTRKVEEIQEIFRNTIAYLEISINNNKRKDGLFHSYNLISFQDDELRIDQLYEMLEGQVAVLTSGMLNPRESLDLLDSMKNSQLYRSDQYSYLLYPNRELKGFLAKNQIAARDISSNLLIAEMIKRNDFRVIEIDAKNNVYFNSDLNNGKILKAKLNLIKSEYQGFEKVCFQQVLDLYENIFNHKAFTGRSGTFFAFEGLGSIYWHMVSKLLLAVNEVLSGTDEIAQLTRGALIDHYYEIRAGIGINKSPEVYGAIPTDPYSHTPAHRGAQQPGMTGQVKEDILNRWAEFGVKVSNGMIHFLPTFLSEYEWLTQSQVFEYISVDGKNESIVVNENELVFTYCQIPIKYIKSFEKKILIHNTDNSKGKLVEGNVLNRIDSLRVFGRNATIKYLEVFV